MGQEKVNEIGDAPALRRCRLSPRKGGGQGKEESCTLTRSPWIRTHGQSSDQSRRLV